MRCLGPGPEHRWVSPDPVRLRVCPRCRDRVAQMNLGVRDLYPSPVMVE